MIKRGLSRVLLDDMWESALRTTILVLISFTANAQSVQLSPEQQMMLDQLPPAQREQALEALRDASGQSETLEPLRETDAQDDLSGDLSPRAADVQRADPRVGEPEPFGYDLFESNEAGFDPPMTGPVPPDYVLGPGDTLRVQFFGNVNAIHEYDVTRDGILNLPELGPVNVAGITFAEFRKNIDERVGEMLIGTQISVTMGQLKTIRVFVLGDANRPGSYVVNSLATISSVLYRSGGISSVGSLRNIQLKRSGNTVARLDLYDLLLAGDTSGDLRLQPGDVIFVPPIGNTVTVTGAVKRPAIYETMASATIADVIDIAGGLAPDAFGPATRLERIDDDRERKTIAVDLTDESARSMRVRAADQLIIPAVLPDLEETVMLRGHVERPGDYEWHDGMRLTDLITTADELLPEVDAEYVLIRREYSPDMPIDVFSVNLADALRGPGGANDVTLQSRDTVYVFSRAAGRQDVIAPLLDELRLHTSIDVPLREAHVSGHVRAPGPYPLEAGMRISDLIRAGGGLAEQAYSLQAELTSYSVDFAETRQVEVRNVDLSAILKGDTTADVELTSHDFLVINRIPEWDSIRTVTIEGEVMFPGEYRIRRDETLGQLLQRVGGLTDKAYPEGAIFLRESLRQREQQQIGELSKRLEEDLTTLSLQEAQEEGESETLTTGRALLAQLRETSATGRLVIDLSSVSAGDLVADIGLREGDRLLVPDIPQAVTVIGQTQQNTSHLYQPGLTRQDYIDLSGGLTRRADKKLIYVVRASGAVIAQSRSKWLGRGKDAEILPGDTIVVPLDVQRVRPLTLWTSVTQIMYQAAIALAAVDSFGN